MKYIFRVTVFFAEDSCRLEIKHILLPNVKVCAINEERNQ